MGHGNGCASLILADGINVKYANPGGKTRSMKTRAGMDEKISRRRQPQTLRKWPQRFWLYGPVQVQREKNGSGGRPYRNRVARHDPDSLPRNLSWCSHHGRGMTRRGWTISLSGLSWSQRVPTCSIPGRSLPADCRTRGGTLRLRRCRLGLACACFILLLEGPGSVVPTLQTSSHVKCSFGSLTGSVSTTKAGSVSSSKFSVA